MLLEKAKEQVKDNSQHTTDASQRQTVGNLSNSTGAQQEAQKGSHAVHTREAQTVQSTKEQGNKYKGQPAKENQTQPHQQNENDSSLKQQAQQQPVKEHQKPHHQQPGKEQKSMQDQQQHPNNQRHQEMEIVWGQDKALPVPEEMPPRKNEESRQMAKPQMEKGELLAPQTEDRDIQTPGNLVLEIDSRADHVFFTSIHFSCIIPLYLVSSLLPSPAYSCLNTLAWGHQQQQEEGIDDFLPVLRILSFYRKVF